MRPKKEVIGVNQRQKNKVGGLYAHIFACYTYSMQYFIADGDTPSTL